ncbi:unnamed protein product, partial [Heterosigma akashiwo]
GALRGAGPGRGAGRRPGAALTGRPGGAGAGAVPAGPGPVRAGVRGAEEPGG